METFCINYKSLPILQFALEMIITLWIQDNSKNCQFAGEGCQKLGIKIANVVFGRALPWFLQLPLGTNYTQSFNFTAQAFKIGDSNYAAHRSVKFLLHTNYAFVMMLTAYN